MCSCACRTRGWSADVERWESDEDSDHTDDEDVDMGLELSDMEVRLLMQ